MLQLASCLGIAGMRLKLTPISPTPACVHVHIVLFWYSWYAPQAVTYQSSTCASACAHRLLQANARSAICFNNAEPSEGNTSSSGTRPVAMLGLVALARPYQVVGGLRSLL